MPAAEHSARCACGRLSLKIAGDPDRVSICNCTQCQRRTGSVFGVGAYFPRASVAAIEGRSETFTRSSEAGRKLTFHFCPGCGTSVYWTLEAFPDHYGIAAGCFDDPGFLAPMRVVWAQHKHHWVEFPDKLPVFPKAAT